MHDLNDLAVFAAVVEHGSFTAAADARGIAKSQISHRVARLEERLGVRLIQRTTRQLHVTEVGQHYYQRCRAMLAEAERAQRVADTAHAAPNGNVLASCPPLLGELILGSIAADFIQAYPNVRLVLDTTNRPVDVVGEGYDVAFRVRAQIGDSSLVVRSFGLVRQALVIAPAWLCEHGRPHAPEELDGLASMATGAKSQNGRYQWRLSGRGKAERLIEHRPRLVTDDLSVLKRAALHGSGIVELPRFFCAGELARGELETVPAGWEPVPGKVHAVYPSRHGQPPAVRSFLDFVAPRIETALRHLQRRSAGARVRPRPS
jgi:DNA-binding transcriptional LysR family regulator